MQNRRYPVAISRPPVLFVRKRLFARQSVRQIGRPNGPTTRSNPIDSANRNKALVRKACSSVDRCCRAKSCATLCIRSMKEGEPSETGLAPTSVRPLRAVHRHESVAHALLQNPAPNILRAPDSHPRREFDRLRKRS